MQLALKYLTTYVNGDGTFKYCKLLSVLTTPAAPKLTLSIPDVSFLSR